MLLRQDLGGPRVGKVFYRGRRHGLSGRSRHRARDRRYRQHGAEGPCQSSGHTHKHSQKNMPEEHSCPPWQMNCQADAIGCDLERQKRYKFDGLKADRGATLHDVLLIKAVRVERRGVLGLFV
ncbi:hypothetical protein, partial [Kitasatospora sp. NPDC047058]|uniref:hypothetical protein n=1 Tax=Kitasatospora sp. NPDC047058 TaxID=3155620 RepID=UPI0033F2B23C